MADKINLDVKNVTLKDALELTKEFEKEPRTSLTPDQIALLDLKEAINRKAVTKREQGAGAGPAECFICITGA